MNPNKEMTAKDMSEDSEEGQIDSDEEEEDIDEQAYNSSYKTHCTGLGSLLGSIREQPRLRDDSDRVTTPQNNWKEFCDTGSNSGPRTQKSQRVTSWHCDVCDLDLNSESMFQQHAIGSKHQKRLRLQNQSSDILAVISTDLRTLIQESTSPVIALHYVEELLPESEKTADCDARYRCNICCTTTGSQNMYNHLVGSRHRSKYLEMRFGLNDLSKEDVMKKAQEIEDKEGRRTNLIRTIVSDAKYPWPAGKAPWSTDQGGTGTPPIGSGDSIYRDQRIIINESDVILDPDLGVTLSFQDATITKNDLKIPAKAILSSIAECSVTSTEDAELAFDVSKALIQRLIQYKSPLCEEEKRPALLACGENLIQSLRTIMIMPVKKRSPNLAETGPSQAKYSKYSR